MNLRHLTDAQLKIDTENLVRNERALLTQILYHLKEIEARKLYSEYGFSSLYEYACRELKYSDDQAYRRIRAMRLIKEIPEVAKKIDSGELSLSNINQAQNHFKQTGVVSKAAKIEVLKKLCHKSVRDGQKEILKLSPVNLLPPETKKQVSPTHTLVSFNMSEELENKFERLKSLLGPKSYNLTMAELMDQLVDLANEKLLEKKFGKKQVNLNSSQDALTQEHPSEQIKDNFDRIEDNLKETKSIAEGIYDDSELQNDKVKEPINKSKHTKKLALNLPSKAGRTVIDLHSTLNVQGELSKMLQTDGRYISKKLRYRIWQKNKYECNKCSSKSNLQIDHVQPHALNGRSDEENLRLLCFNCNQRGRITARL